jgi:hypothetical protein
MVEQLKDIDARWKALHQMLDSVAFAKDKDPATAYVGNPPIPVTIEYDESEATP